MLFFDFVVYRGFNPFQCAIRKLDFLGLFHLFKLFMRYCYEPDDPNQDLFAHTYVPKPNDFSEMPEYFVRKVNPHPQSLDRMLTSVGLDKCHIAYPIREWQSSSGSAAVFDRPATIQRQYQESCGSLSNPSFLPLLIEIPQYSDGFYICTVISAAACALVSAAPPERGELLPAEARQEHNSEDISLVQQTLTEIDRYRSMDRLIPSPHNMVTIAALEVIELPSLWIDKCSQMVVLSIA